MQTIDKLQKSYSSFFVSLVLILFNFNFSIGQSYIDSLALSLVDKHDSIKVKSYNNAFREVMRFDLELAKGVADSLMLYAVSEKNKDMIARATSIKGSYYYLHNDFDTAIVIYNKAIEQYKEIGSLKEIAGTLINVGNCHGEVGDVVKAMETYLESLRIQEELGIIGMPIATNLENIGVTYAEMKEHSKALTYYRRARKIYAELEDTQSLAKLDFNISLQLFDIDSISSAQKILDRLEIYHRKNQNVYALTDVLLESGKNYGVKGELNRAEEMMLEALQLAQDNNDQGVYGIIYNKLMGLYIEKGDQVKAEKYALLSFEESKKDGFQLGVITDLSNLSGIYETKKDYKKALNYYKEYHTLNDSLLGIEKYTMVEEMKTKYETEKKEKEIELLQAKEAHSKIVKYGLMALLLLLSSIFGVSIYAYQQRLFKNKIAKEKVDQELEFNNKELELRKKELTAYALQLAHKNEILDEIKGKVGALEEYNTRATQKIINTINLNKNNEGSWDGFRNRFKAIHHNFESNVQEKYPTVTSNELRLMSLIKMNLNNKEIAEILNISPDGIKKARYRLRKKMELVTEDSLEQSIMKIG